MSPLRRSRRDEPGPPDVALPAAPGGILQVCHPDWRGVRASAEAFGDPVALAQDLHRLIPALGVVDPGLRLVVIQGWPPGAAPFAIAAANAGLDVAAVSHSAPTQHGVDAGEAEALSQALDLAADGVISRVGVVKAGLAPSLCALGHDVWHVPNRVPQIERPDPEPLDGSPVGIFLFPMWRKNVVTQVLAAVELGWTPHLMAAAEVPYLDTAGSVVHGELGRSEFLRWYGSMHMNFNVTLSECHPMMPMESYRLGVPCLLSRTSDLFVRDRDLYELTTVDTADDPHGIAAAASRLDGHRGDVVAAANGSLDDIDIEAGAAWAEFTRGA